MIDRFAMGWPLKCIVCNTGRGKEKVDKKTVTCASNPVKVGGAGWGERERERS